MTSERGDERGGVADNAAGDDTREGARGVGTAGGREANGDIWADVTDSDAGGATEDASTPTADIEALDQRIAELTRAVERQNELLERQTQHLSALAEQIESDRED